ncbi:MAG: hypothetical protein QNJ14_08245 [Woeseiaceae bacterium]|nr:hypothetical protein [Woeseiaceae bacterium]
MSRNRRDNLRGYAEPVLRVRPLFIRLCEAFVDNLSLILRIALVMGAISFVDSYFEHRPELSPADENFPEQVVAEDPQTQLEQEPGAEPWLTDGVEHALKCTHTEFRNEHFDECVKEPSEVYTRPGADPDDTSSIVHGNTVLYASLTPSADRTLSDR